MTEVPSPFLVTVNGQDGPGIAERLFAALAERGIAVDDVEQVRVHGRLLLCVEAAMVRADAETVRALLEDRFAGAGVVVTVDPLVEAAMDDDAEGHLVTLLAPEIDAATLESVTGSMARCGGNIVRIVRLAAYPVHSYEFSVAGADVDAYGAHWPRPPPGAGSIWPCRRLGCTAGPASDCVRRRFHLGAGRDDRPAGGALRLRPGGGGGHRGRHGG